jgi:hypothetical protein
MRLDISCFILLVGLAGCGPEGPCGYLGCDDGEVCTENGCEPCGGEGESCCTDSVYGSYCTDPGYGCQPYDGPGYCTPDCGAPGKACCEDAGGWGVCDGQAACSYDMCPGSVSDPCNDGDTLYTFMRITAECEAIPVAFVTNSFEEAQECLANAITLGPNEEVCDPNVPVQQANVCEEGESFGWIFNYCTTAQLAACEALKCGEASCTWVECP